jgi:quinol-cytochrome oxidoreductase complex cytochrome b subunit
LRSIPRKLGGVTALVASILILLVIPFVAKGYMKRCRFQPLVKECFWVLVAVFLLLTWAGAQLVEMPYVSLSQGLGIAYFSLYGA